MLSLLRLLPLPWTTEHRDIQGARLFRCVADHHRVVPVESRFEARLEYVMVDLAAVTRARSLRTPIGWVHERDHLLGYRDGRLRALRSPAHYRQPAHSGEEIVASLNEVLSRDPYACARVELLTTARLLGDRCAPLAIYFGYRRLRDELPSFYVLETGTADGKPRVLFCAPSMDDEPMGPAGYEPTPYSCATRHYYRASLSGGPDKDIELSVAVLAPTEAGEFEPFLFTELVFSHGLDAQRLRSPFVALLVASCRLGPIGRAIHKAPGTHIGRPFEAWMLRRLAPIGSRLPWKVKPRASRALPGPIGDQREDPR